MRLILSILISFLLVLQAQGAASLLSDCLSWGNVCKMEMPSGSTCGCEHADDLPILPAVSGDCPYDCMNCNLEAHAAEILLSVQSISRTAEVYRVLECVVKMSLAEWSFDPLDVLSDTEIEVPPPHRPMTDWGVWRL